MAEALDSTLEKTCMHLKVVTTTNAGFMWAFEMLSNNTSEGKKKLTWIEHTLKRLYSENSKCPNSHRPKLHELVAAYISEWGRHCRGYVTFISQEKGTMYRIFCLDYGSYFMVGAKNLRPFPVLASLSDLEPQALRIAPYGVSARSVEISLVGAPENRKNLAWRPTDIKFMETEIQRSGTVYFNQVCQHSGVRFGIIYLKDIGSETYVPLNDLLVMEQNAMKNEHFEKDIPTLIKLFKRSHDYLDIEKNVINNYSSEVLASVKELGKSEVKCVESATKPEVRISENKDQSFTSRNINMDISTSSPKESKQITPKSLTGPPKCPGGRGKLLPPSPRTPNTGGSLYSADLKNSFTSTPPDRKLASEVSERTLNAYDNDAMVDCGKKSNGRKNDSLSPSTSRKSTEKGVSDNESETSFKSDLRLEILKPFDAKALTDRVNVPTGVRDCNSVAESVISLVDVCRPFTDLVLHPTEMKKESSESVSTGSPSSLRRFPVSPSSNDSGSGKRLLGSNESVSGILDSPVSTGSKNSSSAKCYLPDLSTSSKSINGSANSLIASTSKNSVNEKHNLLVSSGSNNESNVSDLPISSSNKSENRKADLPISSASNNVSNVRVLSISSTSNGTPKAQQSPKCDDSTRMEESTSLRMAPTNAIIEDNVLIDPIMSISCEQLVVKNSVYEQDIHPDIKNNLRELHVRDLLCCQKFMIPAMTTRKNVILVDRPKSGKSLGCLIGLTSMLKDTRFYATLPIGTGPKAIVLCPHSARCEFLFEQASRIAKRRNNPGEERSPELLIHVAYGCGKELEKETLEELTKSYDIVICTPTHLLRLLDSKKRYSLNFKRLCHIVFDEAHILFRDYKNEVAQIFKQIQYKKLNDLVRPQRVIISNNWIPELTSSIKRDIYNQGLILFSSYLEAAIFSKVTALLWYLDSKEKKIHHLEAYLDKEGLRKNVVIVCNEDSDLEELQQSLRNNRNIYSLKVFDSVKTQETIDSWNEDVYRRKYPILLCTDYTLSEIRIYGANLLIHYNLPPQKHPFSFRFRVLLNSLSVPLDYYSDEKKGSMLPKEKPEVLIYALPDNYEQFPTIVEVMEKLNGKIPANVTKMADRLKAYKDRRKENTDVCLNLKMFGKCFNEAVCEQRHTLNYKKDAPAPEVPQEGRIKFDILQVYSATHFGVRVREYTDHSGKWAPFKSGTLHPMKIEGKMRQFFANPDNKILHICKKVGEVAAAESPFRSYERVKIMTLIDDEKPGMKTVNVRYLETGKETLLKASTLFKLPDELASIPPSTVDVFVGNLLPVDRDIMWGEKIREAVKKEIDNLKNDKDCYFVGKIKLVYGRCIWLAPLECQKLYKSINMNMSEFSMHKYLLQEEMAIPNMEHLTCLAKKFGYAGLPISEDLLAVLSGGTSNESGMKEEPKTKGSEEAVVPVEQVKEETETKELEKEARQSSPKSENSNADESTIEQSDTEQEMENSEHTDTTYYTADTSAASTVENGQRAVALNEKSLQLVQPNTNYVTEVINNSPIHSDAECLDSDDSDQMTDYTDNTFGNFDVDITEEEAVMFLQSLGICVPQGNDTKEDDIAVKPTIYWYQTVEEVNLTINLNCDDYRFKNTDKTIFFRAVVDGKLYEFKEELWARIEGENVRHWKSGVTIRVKMEKIIKSNKWKRLLKRTDFQKWIKNDTNYTDEDYVRSAEPFWPIRPYQNPAIEDITEKIDYSQLHNSVHGPIYPEGYGDSDNNDSDSEHEHGDFGD